MREKLEQLAKAMTDELAGVKTLAELQSFEVEKLGRKSEFNALLKGLGGLSPEDRKTVGMAANRLKQEVQAAFDAKKAELESTSAGALADAERIDVTVPGIRPPQGHLHLTSQAISEITAIFRRIGFSRVRHPEVDWDWYAFESLNMPGDHPARDEWETFFVDAPNDPKKGKMVLTPHTSNGQVREMEKRKLPIRMINIAKCYRRQIDVSHVPMFHQFEGLLIDRHVSVTHLKGVLDHFAREFFGPDRVTRLRPFHFRFTEPSFEVDISCGICGGTGKLEGGAKCRLCKEGWLELGGAGMVHPNVLKAGKIDPEEWGGFAFGWGVERTMAMKSGVRIDDIRVLYKSDFRFLKQF
ncbi:MAG TPA: phenylalanine--tRNA ligase subunit alpha [Candidatus Eisenbacteria bacterium]|nr:phenylalanine--tRNA ligase subunit alpha [Candidatus Eisenbacteria bacterium]